MQPNTRGAGSGRSLRVEVLSPLLNHERLLSLQSEYKMLVAGQERKRVLLIEKR
jgi:hypothetical protein